MVSVVGRAGQVRRSVPLGLLVLLLVRLGTINASDWRTIS
jgi:hypothetical protein